MPKPKKGESEKKYVSRCVKHRQSKENKDESRSKSAAVCHSMYDKKKKKKK